MTATLDYLLETLPWLHQDGVEDISIHQPGQAWVYNNGWSCHDAPALMDPQVIEDIAIVAGAQRRQDVTYERPLLSTDVGGLGRLQAVLHPSVEYGKPCLVIRRGVEFWPTIAELAVAGIFKRTQKKRLIDVNAEMIALYADNDFEQFFRLAVRNNLTILYAGVVASGKTTFMKAILRETPRRDMRIATVQDTPELMGLERFLPNAVQLFYDKENKDLNAPHLIEAGLRLRPEKLVLQEIRDGQSAVALMLAMQSGFKVNSTIHADHCLGAFDRMRYLIKQMPGGAAIKDEDLMQQLQDLVDVVVHTSRDGSDFEIDEVWYRPVSGQ